MQIVYAVVYAFFLLLFLPSSWGAELLAIGAAAMLARRPRKYLIWYAVAVDVAVGISIAAVVHRQPFGLANVAEILFDPLPVVAPATLVGMVLGQRPGVPRFVTGIVTLLAGAVIGGILWGFLHTYGLHPPNYGLSD